MLNFNDGKTKEEVVRTFIEKLILQQYKTWY